MHLPSKIISGGQTGVDRAALEAARECGVAIGRWVPLGRIAEDGEISREDFPELQETPSDDPAERTEWNARDSDATLIIAKDGLMSKSPGTRLTHQLTGKLGKPALILNRNNKSTEELLADLRRWLDTHKPATLNVAGPRKSENKDLANLTGYLLLRLYRRIPEPKDDRLLRMAGYFSIFGVLLVAILGSQTGGYASLSTVIFSLAAGVSILGGSLGSLRFATFTLGVSSLLSLPIIFYHIATLKPFVLEQSGAWYPINSPEFWTLFVSPTIFVAGLFRLLILVHQKRRIKFWSKAVKVSTGCLVALVLSTLLFRVLSGPQEGTLDSAQKEQLRQISAFFEKNGPPSAGMSRREESFCDVLKKGGKVGYIHVSSASAPGHSFHFGSTDLILGRYRRSSFSSKKVTFELDDGRVWKGHEEARYIRTTSGEWLKLEIAIGDFVDSE